MNILDQNFQKEVIQEAFITYRNCWKEISLSESLKEKFLKAGISEEFVFKTFKNENHFPIKVYFTQFLLNINFIKELINEDDSDYLFDFWNTSEFTSLFFNNLKNTDDDIIQASKLSASALEDHFCDYFCFNFDLSKKETFKIKTNPEIGDYENRLYSPNFIINLKTAPKEDENGFFYLQKSSLERDNNPETKIDGIILRPGSKNGEVKINSFKEKIEKALIVIKNCCPELYKTFKNFSHTIIALNEPGMVSFSLQSLPGYSSINLFERDFVDCIDDLLHENGHHFLNYILNSKDLIIESPEKDYFSPWRMTYRPLRGLYHGTFTFYWALKLFSGLNHNPKTEEYLSNEELTKVKFRYVEEFFRLNACKEPINKAINHDLINDDGIKLINSVFELIELETDKVNTIFKSLNDHQKETLEEVKKSLKSS